MEDMACRKMEEGQGKKSLAEVIARFDTPEWRKHCDEAAAERQRVLDENPDNGRIGWWHVDGIRHSALVRASSAREAVDKALVDGAVGDWESPSARYMSDTLPDVVSL